MTDQHKIEAYACAVGQKQEVVNRAPVFTAEERPAVQGTCAVCGTKVFRMGETPAAEDDGSSEARRRPGPRAGWSSLSRRRRRVRLGGFLARDIPCVPRSGTFVIS